VRATQAAARATVVTSTTSHPAAKNLKSSLSRMDSDHIYLPIYIGDIIEHKSMHIINTA
jgi:hypothetical protein